MNVRRETNHSNGNSSIKQKVSSGEFTSSVEFIREKHFFRQQKIRIGSWGFPIHGVS
jgi:hypothetical protein